MTINISLQVLLAFACAALIALSVTPIIRVFAYKIGAVDIPKDNRRMHKKPMPLLGGLAIFLGVTVAGFLFCEITPRLLACWAGGLIIIVFGILDDKYALNPWVKLAGQIAAAAVVIPFGVRVEFIELFGRYIKFGVFTIPITILWIVGMTNAINLIDGLDGLACGVSAICSATLLIVALIHAEMPIAVITAILTGACIGFLPFNFNPAKIFMGDTGALFLGYMLSVISVVGVFKMTAAVSFLIPIIIFGYPLFDTFFAFFRRILHGRSPFSADRGHLHHRMIDMGFNVRQAVVILYCVCSILGILAIMLSERRMAASIVILFAALCIGLLNYFLVSNKSTRELTGFSEPEKRAEKSAAEPPKESAEPQPPEPSDSTEGQPAPEIPTQDK